MNKSVKGIQLCRNFYVQYDESVINLEKYWSTGPFYRSDIIERHDIGTQYRTGVYYTDEMIRNHKSYIQSRQPIFKANRR